MSTIEHPNKQTVREYFAQRACIAMPPPTPEEIRRQLGWGMLLSDFKVAPRRNGTQVNAGERSASCASGRDMEKIPLD